MTTLVTGASGFLGRHVLAQLAGQPLRVLALPDDPARSELGRQAEVVTGDVTRLESLPPALEGITEVVHLAGFVNGGRGPADIFMSVNAQGTDNLARAARAAGVTHFVYTSSITVYGHVEDADESAALVSTPGYAASKIDAERRLRELLPGSATILRLPLVLGAGDTGFLCPALRGFRRIGRVTLVGSGHAPWSVLAASDAARAIALCLELPETRGGTYNVLGQMVTNGELLRAIGGGAGCTSEIRLPKALAWGMAALSELVGRDDLTRGQVRALSRPLSMNADRFTRLGFVPKMSWRDALAQGVAWCAENYDV